MASKYEGEKFGTTSGEGRVNEYEMLTRASLHSNPTLLLCHLSSAWHEAARIWVQINEGNRDFFFLGSSQKQKKTYSLYQCETKDQR